MRRARKAPDIPLNQLRLAHLLEAPAPHEGRLVNLKVPADTLRLVHDLARRLGVGKAATLVALLNEGLIAAEKRRTGRR